MATEKTAMTSKTLMFGLMLPLSSIVTLIIGANLVGAETGEAALF